MNSLPSRLAGSSESRTRARARHRVVFFQIMTRAISGRYTAISQRFTGLSASRRKGPRMKISISTGTRVTERRAAPAMAKVLV